MNTITFNTAIELSSHYTRRHLILGNGFSISCIPSIFTYKSIYDEANFEQYQEIRDLFTLVETTDFEEVVFSLEQSLKIIPFYVSDNYAIINTIATHSTFIKELLIKTIANKHPDMPSDISDSKYRTCRKFLSNFVSTNSKGCIYSLNYDLLLYWSLMHSFDDEQFELTFNDGFVKEFDEVTHEPSTELFWEGKTSDQNLHFLHGSLHLYQGLGLLEKNTWKNTGVRLITQARAALQKEKFPLFVSEGNSDKKMSKIFHNPYLFNSYKSFEDVCNGGKSRLPGNTCIFTYGLSFSENDLHIFNKIAYGRIKHLFVSIYGNPDDTTNTIIVNRCEQLKEKRTEFPLEITYYDAVTACVWG